ncbi:hypothetical protein ACFSZQ_05455 [Sphingobacterium arenae]
MKGRDGISDVTFRDKEGIAQRLLLYRVIIDSLRAGLHGFFLVAGEQEKC